MEIERKFLLQEIPNNITEYKCDIIRQGYISTNPVIRIRNKGSLFFLTCKSKGLMQREEFEEEITQAQFDHLTEKIDHHLISKRRYYVPIDKELTAEVDIFLDQLKGLALVEVEFDSEEDAQQFIAPDWFGTEVTFIPSYQNNHLCQLNNLSSLTELNE